MSQGNGAVFKTARIAATSRQRMISELVFEQPQNGRRLMRVSVSAENYVAEWTDPKDPGTQCGVSGASLGVNFWWCNGPGPNDGYGRSYTWEEWFDHGSCDSGGPDDLLTQL
jgi:hypothetical protein